MKNDKFTKNVEGLVDPVEVGSLHFIQYFNNFVPKKIQKKLINSSGAKTPYMGFIVDPYSYFLCYPIKNLDLAKNLLPHGFELTKTSVFKGQEPNYYSIIGCFNAHTSGFFGFRTEFYIIAENKSTGMLSWIIVDYDTNTISYDPKNILCDANSKGSFFTTDFSGMIYADIKNNNNRRLSFNSNLNGAKFQTLDQRLWVEGNLSIAYGRNKCEDDPGLFSLTFDPLEFEKALNIPLSNLEVIENTWFTDLIQDKPSEAVCFPYAQHFISDSPGHSTLIKNETELISKVDSIDFSKVNVFSTESIKKSFIIGGIISAFINLILLILLIIK